MEYFFFPDVYADRQLIDYYVLVFNLRSESMVRLVERDGRRYIVDIYDWESFKRSAYNVILYEMGDEIGRFEDIETALRTAYRMAYTDAVRLNPKRVEPSLGVGAPPLDVIKRVFPVEFSLDPFPADLDAFLEEVVRSLNETGELEL